MAQPEHASPIPDNWFTDNIKLVIFVIDRFRKRWRITKIDTVEFLGAAYSAFDYLRKLYREDKGMTFSSFFCNYSSRYLVVFLANEGEFYSRRCAAYRGRREVCGTQIPLEGLLTGRELRIRKTLYRLPRKWIVDPVLSLDNSQGCCEEDIQCSLQKAWKNMPTRYRGVLQDYLWKDLTFRQIGDKLHVTAERARQLYVKAIHYLQTYRQVALSELADTLGMRGPAWHYAKD